MIWLVVLIALSGAAGAAMVIVGIYLLAGLPWMLIAAGAATMGFAAMLRRGLTTDG